MGWQVNKSFENGKRFFSFPRFPFATRFQRDTTFRRVCPEKISPLPFPEFSSRTRAARTTDRFSRSLISCSRWNRRRSGRAAMDSSWGTPCKWTGEGSRLEAPWWSMGRRSEGSSRAGPSRRRSLSSPGSLLAPRVPSVFASTWSPASGTNTRSVRRLNGILLVKWFEQDYFLQFCSIEYQNAWNAFLV